MITSAWRQNRLRLLVSLGLIAIPSVASLIAGMYAWGYPQLGWRFGDICSRWNDVGPCRPETALTLSTLVALLMPLLFGIFVGVLTVFRDLPQPAERIRWYIARIIVVFLPISVAMVGLGLALYWATGRARHSTQLPGRPSISFSRFDFAHFETSGISIGAYTFTTLLVGSALAVGFRHRTLAKLGTLFLFLILPVAFTFVVRDEYGTPSRRTEPIDGLSRASEYPRDPYYTTDGTWVVGAGYVDANGDRVRPDTDACAQKYPDDYWAEIQGESAEQRSARMTLDARSRADQFDACLRDQGVDRFDVYFYREDDFWRFQATESAVVLAFGSAAAAFGMWRLRRMPKTDELLH